METTNSEKKQIHPKDGFDAVKMMREIRDQISKETKNMTFEQLKAYIHTKLTENNVKLIGEK